MFHIRSHIFHFKHNYIKQSCNYISPPQCLNINMDKNTAVIHQSGGGLIWTKGVVGAVPGQAALW